LKQWLIASFHPTRKHQAARILVVPSSSQRHGNGFLLKDPEGNVFNSVDVLKRGPLVLSFYRGVWCPYCNMELQALEAAKPAFERYGASLVEISPQAAPNSRKSVRQSALSFVASSRSSTMGVQS
jgi:peroxiredoxin